MSVVLTAQALGAPPEPVKDAAAPELRGRELLPDARLTPKEERYTIRFEPSVWYAAPGGKLRMPGAPASAPQLLLEDFNLDRPRLSPFGELHVRSDDWRVSISGFAVSLNNQASQASQAGQVGPVPFAAGDRFISSVSVASGDCVIARELGAPDSINGTRDPTLAVSFEAFGGVRFYDISFDFAAPAGATHINEFFIQPVAGLKSTLNVTSQVTIDVQLGAGGFTDGRDHASLSYDILVGFMYRPTENLGLQVGYRLFIYNLNDGPDTAKFEYRGATAGVYGGLVFRF